MSRRLRLYTGKLGVWRGTQFYLRAKLGRGLLRAAPPGWTQPLYLRRQGSDRRIFDMIFFQGHYDIPVDFQPRVIVDAGANAGFAAALFAHRFPAARVLAIEPDDANFEVLKLNASLFPNIEPIHGALWGHDARLSIANPDAAKLSIRLREDAGAGAVEAFSVETLMARHGLEHIDLFKIDIEGSELSLFTDPGAQRWLPKVRKLVIELHDRPGFPPGIGAAFDAAIAPFPHTRSQAGEDTIVDFHGVPSC